MAPYARVTKSTIQMYGFEMSAHRIVGMTMATLMRMPPMVGVPAFCWCDFGPSSRMYWPALMGRIPSISHGAKMNEMISAVSAHHADRKVMQRKTLKPEIMF